MADATTSEREDAQTDQPDPYQDTQAIVDLVRRKREEWGRGREQIIRAAYRNLLFQRGHQWVRWDRGTNRFRPARVPKGTPTPVTNVFAATMDAVVAVFARIEPRLNFAPGNPEEAEDRAAADVATRAINVVEDETAIRTQRQALAAWVGYTGGAWLENGYDPDPMHGTVTLEVEQCAACQHVQAPGAMACEECQSAELVPGTVEAPKGKQYVDVCSIFEMFFDPSITEWTRQRAYIREKAVPEDEAKSRWKTIAESIKGHIVGGMDEWYSESLPTLGPLVDESQTSRMLWGTGGQQRGMANRVLEQWYWQLPDDTYPEGLLAVVVGRTSCAHAGPLPYGALEADGSRRPFLPHVFFPQKLVPGTAFAKTVADDVALIQVKRNQWESICIASGTRVGSPIWLRPSGSNARNLSGEPGQVVDYNPHPQHAQIKPERVAGQGIPLAFVKMIEMSDKDLEQVAACLTGDQEIPCLDGVTRTMEELARTYPDGGMWVYGYDLDTMRIVPSRVESAFLTGRKRCVRVSFDEGTHVDASWDHPFLTWDRGYVKAEDLRPGDALVPLTFGTARGYPTVYQPRERTYEDVHRMVAHAKWGIAPRGDRRHVHHRDKQRANNVPDNLDLLDGRVHVSEHVSEWWRQKDEEAKRRRLDPMLYGMRQYWKSLTLAERSERNKAAAESIPAEARRERALKAVAGRGADWGERKSEERKAWWANRSQEERNAHAATMRAARANHKVRDVVEIGEVDVFDLQTTTGNFGTAAGVITRNTYDVIKGARPEGVSAGVALQILQERGMSRFGPQFILWEAAWAQQAYQMLEIFRQFATEERLLRIKGRDGAWEVQKFAGADLSGRVDVIPEAGSSMPRSTMVERAELEQAFALGLLNRADPETRFEALAKFGMTHMLPSLAADTKNAIREDEAFEALAQDPTLAQAVPEDVTAIQTMDYPTMMASMEVRGVKVPKVHASVDDHAVHVREHAKWLKSETAQQMPEIVFALAEKHNEYHQMLMIQQAQAQQGILQPMTPGITAQPPARTQAMNTSSSPARMEGDFNEMSADVAQGDSSGALAGAGV